MMESRSQSGLLNVAELDRLIYANDHLGVRQFVDAAVAAARAEADKYRQACNGAGMEIDDLKSQLFVLRTGMAGLVEELRNEAAKLSKRDYSVAAAVETRCTVIADRLSALLEGKE